MSTSTTARAAGAAVPAAVPAPQRRRSPGAVAVLVVSALVAAALVAVGASTLVTLAVRQHTSGSASLAGVTAVDVQLDSCGGGVDVRPGPSGGQDARVSWRDGWGLRRPEHAQVVRDGRLQVRAGCPLMDTGWTASSDLRLVVPAAVPVTVRAGSGDVRAQRLTGALDLRTGSGDVRVEQVSGDLVLGTGSGDVVATATGGARLRAGAGSGDVTLRAVAAARRVRVSTGSGDVLVEVPDDGAPYAVSTRTGSGDEHVGVPDDPRAARSVQLSTGSGNITVGPARS